MNIIKLIEQKGFTVEKAGLLTAIMEEYSNDSNEGALYEMVESFVRENKVSSETILFLENEGYITMDYVFKKLVVRSSAVKVFTPELDNVAEVIEYLNKKTGKRFSTKSQSSRRFIGGRLKEGYTVEDCKGVIDTMTTQWSNDRKMRFYLRPETLFNETKFQGYYALYLEYKERSDENDWTVEKV